jgi:hypothetical protein
MKDKAITAAMAIISMVVGAIVLDRFDAIRFWPARQP